MHHNLAKYYIFPLLLFLPGCSAVGEKACSISIVYGVTAILSFILLAGYCFLNKKKEICYLLLFSSILIVNIGYFALSISQTLKAALFANRLAYLGSVFLPFSMYFIILNVTKIIYRKWLPAVLLGIGIVIFLIAASPGYLTIYYKEVSLEQLNGVTTLNKVYGPLHPLYLFYLIGYFLAMMATIVYAIIKNKIDSPIYAVLLATAVFVNIGVWFIEQLVRIDFEILSLSYIISECFLLGLHLLMKENEKNTSALQQKIDTIPVNDPLPIQEPKGPSSANEQSDPAQLELFVSGISLLTPKEQALYQCYIEGMTTAQILEHLNIKENTLKFHNKNLYGKLGVSSRKQLLFMYKQYSDSQKVFDQ